MKRQGPKIRFWGILAVINLAVMAYPVSLYLQANTDDLLFASVVMVGTGMVLALTNAMSVLLAYLS